MSPVTKIVLSTMILLAALVTSGCDEKDERLARMAEEATQRQAEQNQEMMRLNREVADSHKRLVENEAKTRQETIGLQKEIVQRDSQGRQELNQLQRETQTATREERTRLDQARDEVEEDRRQIATQRNRDPIIANTISGLGLLLACLLPLVLAIYLLRAVRHEDPAEAELAELLAQELVADQPVLFSPYPTPYQALEQENPGSRPALAAEEPPQEEPDDSEPEDHSTGPPRPEKEVT